MQKVIFSTDDILNECLVRADMKGFEMNTIQNMEKKIMEDGFSLVRYYRKYPGFKGSIYMCEWNENGVRERDDWVKHPNKFLYAVAENYIEDAMHLGGSIQQ